MLRLRLLHQHHGAAADFKCTHAAHAKASCCARRLTSGNPCPNKQHDSVQCRWLPHPHLHSALTVTCSWHTRAPV